MTRVDGVYGTIIVRPDRTCMNCTHIRINNERYALKRAGSLDCWILGVIS